MGVRQGSASRNRGSPGGQRGSIVILPPRGSDEGAPPVESPEAKRVVRHTKGPLGNFDLDEGPDALPVSEQIVIALMANAGKVIDLFRSWDVNDDGTVTRPEFHKAMVALGLEVPAQHIDTIFTRWDRDGGGETRRRSSRRSAC